MPFNGSGVYQRVRNWVADATAGVKIRADFHDAEDDGFADGLTNCITRDGQTTITQNIPFHGKRITGLADPINDQDAATKKSVNTLTADKLPLTGGTMTGDLTIKKSSPTFTLDALALTEKLSIIGSKLTKARWAVILGDDAAESTDNSGSNFAVTRYADDGTLIGNALHIDRKTGLATVLADPTAALGVVTKQYADTADNLRLPLTGGTITGALTVNGELLSVANYIRFGTAGGPAYLGWTSGMNYTAGGYTIWHSGNLAGASMITNVRLTFVADHSLTYDTTMHEPYPGAVATGFAVGYLSGTYPILWSVRFRYLQVYTTSWWTVGTA